LVVGCCDWKVGELIRSDVLVAIIDVVVCSAARLLGGLGKASMSSRRSAHIQ
jgi:hypothetical protein